MSADSRRVVARWSSRGAGTLGSSVRATAGRRGASAAGRRRRGRVDSMITRQGRSASTVSSVLPNSAPPVRGAAAASRSRARASRAPPRRSARPACPARTFSQCPVTRRPPCSRACSMIAWAAASCSGSAASIGDEAGTAIVTSTWMPAPAARGELAPRSRSRPASKCAGLERDEHRLVLGLVLDDRARDRDLRASS